MVDFLTWVRLRLLVEGREELVPQSVLQSYDRAFQQALGQLIRPPKALLFSPVNARLTDPSGWFAPQRRRPGPGP